MVDVLAFLNTMKSIQTVQVVYGQLGALQVHRKGYIANILSNPLQLSFEDQPTLRKKILEIPGIKELSPRIQFNGMISVPPTPPSPDAVEEEQTSFLTITAIDPSLERNVCPTVYDWIVKGRMLGSVGARELVINGEVADSIKADVVTGAVRVPRAVLVA